MGLCYSEEMKGTPDQQDAAKAKAKSKELEKELKHANQVEEQFNKLLLLGAGDSGKSTLFKQMQRLYGPGFDVTDRKSYVTTICNNITISIKALADHAEKSGGTIEHKEARDAVMDLKEDTLLTPQMGTYIAALWSDKAIQAAYENRSMIALTDSTEYYFGRLPAVVQPDYVPSVDDVLRSRQPTTGIIESTFEIQGTKFRVMDVGGQRSERKKWINCFDQVTSILFVAALSGYDQCLYEEQDANQMKEALTLYDEIVNKECFTQTSMILFLNKKDIFAQKINKYPLSKVSHFQEFKGSGYDESLTYLQSLFKACNRVAGKEVYTHVTCATDNDQIQHVFEDVKDIIVKKILKVLM